MNLMKMDMALRTSFFLYFCESGAGHSHSYRDAGSFLHIICLPNTYVPHTKRSSRPVLQGSPTEEAAACVQSPSPIVQNSPPFCLALSESATCHHWRRPLTTTTGLLYSLPSSSSSFSCFGGLLLIFNRLLQALGSAQKPLVTPTSILLFLHCNPNA